MYVASCCLLTPAQRDKLCSQGLVGAFSPQLLCTASTPYNPSPSMQSHQISTLLCTSKLTLALTLRLGRGRNYALSSHHHVLRRYPAVRAPNVQVLGLLRRGESLERIGVFRDGSLHPIAVVLEDVVHRTFAGDKRTVCQVLRRGARARGWVGR